jgi:hypothetical protein
MYWFGLFITAADVLIALAITSGSAKSVDKKESKQRNDPQNRLELGIATRWIP